MSGGRPAEPGRWTWWAAALTGAIAGLGAYQLGDGAREFNVMAPPALILVCWSCAAYVIVVARRVGGGRVAIHAGGVAAWFGRRYFSGGSAGGRIDQDALRRAVARASAHMHVFAAGVAVGVIAGIYLRGLVVEYRAVWESTFLRAEQASGILGVILAPAAVMTGIEPPTRETLEGLRGGGPAADWLHLWAATVFLFAFLPRLLLTGIVLAGGRRRATRWDKTSTGTGEPLALVAYCLPGGTVRARELAGAAARALGAPPDPSLLGLIHYGDEHECLPLLEGAGSGSRLVLLAGIASTPEAETHGRLVQLVAEQAAPPVVALDARDWRERGLDDPRRIEARLAAWREAAPHASAVVVLDDIHVHSDPSGS